MNIFKNILLISIPGGIVRAVRRTSLNVRVAAFLIFCGLCVAAYIYSTHQSDQTFNLEYAVYANLAGEADNAAFVPGAQTNPVRIALDQDLTRALDQSISAANRLQFATQGLADLKESLSQIDTISSTTAKVDIEIAKMQVAALGDVSSSDRGRQIISLAKQRSSIISDIRAYSYHTDSEIQQIFQHLVDSQGVLANDYVISLNNEIPTVETEFDKRTALYTQLQNTAQQIDNIFHGTNAQAASAGS